MTPGMRKCYCKITLERKPGVELFEILLLLLASAHLLVTADSITVLSFYKTIPCSNCPLWLIFTLGISWHLLPEHLHGFCRHWLQYCSAWELEPQTWTQLPLSAIYSVTQSRGGSLEFLIAILMTEESLSWRINAALPDLFVFVAISLFPTIMAKFMEGRKNYFGSWHLYEIFFVKL